MPSVGKGWKRILLSAWISDEAFTLAGLKKWVSTACTTFTNDIFVHHTVKRYNSRLASFKEFLRAISQRTVQFITTPKSQKRIRHCKLLQIIGKTSRTCSQNGSNFPNLEKQTNNTDLHYLGRVNSSLQKLRHVKLGGEWGPRSRSFCCTSPRGSSLQCWSPKWCGRWHTWVQRTQLVDMELLGLGVDTRHRAHCDTPQRYRPSWCGPLKADTSRSSSSPEVNPSRSQNSQYHHGGWSGVPSPFGRNSERPQTSELRSNNRHQTGWEPSTRANTETSPWAQTFGPVCWNEKGLCDAWASSLHSRTRPTDTTRSTTSCSEGSLQFFFSGCLRSFPRSSLVVSTPGPARLKKSQTR